MNAVTCIICHDPHTRTGNAVNPDDSRDFQLRYPEVVIPAASNTVGHPDQPRAGTTSAASATTPAVTSGPPPTARPHHSIQSNVYIGDMPMPAGQENTPLVPNTNSVHRFVPAQCPTCHMFRQPSPSQFAPPIAGHDLLINLDACDSATGCHPSPASADADKTTLQTEVQTRLDGIASRLGPLSTWGYSAEGGPPAGSQAAIPDTVKQIRFLYFYVLNDGSLGVHNPSYVRAILTRAEALLTSIGK